MNRKKIQIDWKKARGVNWAKGRSGGEKFILLVKIKLGFLFSGEKVLEISFLLLKYLEDLFLLVLPTKRGRKQLPIELHVWNARTTFQGGSGSVNNWQVSCMCGTPESPFKVGPVWWTTELPTVPCVYVARQNHLQRCVWVWWKNLKVHWAFKCESEFGEKI